MKTRIYAAPAAKGLNKDIDKITLNPFKPELPLSSSSTTIRNSRLVMDEDDWKWVIN